MSDIYDLLIVGGGPAGLIAGIFAGKAGLRCAILEKNAQPGKKLLVAGQGRCNITNSIEITDFLNAYGVYGNAGSYNKKKNFIKHALLNFTNRELIFFLENAGLKLIELNDGKIFPGTEKSLTVLNTLLEQLESSGTTIMTSKPVTNITTDGSSFFVECDNDTFRSKTILLTTGGYTYPQLGTTGDGYILAENLGHKVITPRPALTGFILTDYYLRNCAGISLSDISLRLIRDNRVAAEIRGDILFTHEGMSGPAVLNISRFYLQGDSIQVNLADRKRDEFDNYLIAYISRNGKKTIKNMLAEIQLAERLILSILQEANIDSSLSVSKLSKQTRLQIVKLFCELSFRITSTGPLSSAMVTAGGVDTAELKAGTMESAIVKGLYFAGEILDVDGDTGGFNLQFAFSSGVLSARSIIDQLKTKNKNNKENRE